MENNFYVGNIRHNKRILNNSIETSVLYTKDNNNFLDLIGERWYDTDSTKRHYVIRESLKKTNIKDYRFDYEFLLTSFVGKENNRGKVRKRVRRTGK